MKPPKLSEAIRLGSILKPQGFGDRRDREDGGATACAFDAARDALGNQTGAIEDIFPELKSFPLECPECQHRYSSPASVISMCLNDYHKWSRQRIADWVEEQERKLETAQLETMEMVSV